VVAEVIHAASLVSLTDQAAQAVFNLGCVVLMNLDALTAILTGSCSQERIAMFADLGPSATPGAGPR
jgi:hypothetical protein